MLSGLLVAILVFSLLSIASWALGDLILSRFLRLRASQSCLARPLLALTLGLGTLGQIIFILGVIGDFYRRPYFAAALLLILLLAARPIWQRVFSTRSQFALPIKSLTVYEILVLLLATIYAIRWLRVAVGFNVGSDVFSTHYAHVKHMISLGHFGHAVKLPFGMDHISNYNPTLMHMLYIPGHLLADERAANLLHWLTQIMLIAAIYILGRHLHSRAAAFLGAAVYLGVGLLANFPMDVQDYSILAVFMLLSIYMLFFSRDDTSVNSVAFAGIFAGFMASTKYYGFIILLPLIALCFYLAAGAWPQRLKRSLLFGSVSILVASPWLLYNLYKFGDILYPFFSNLHYARLLGTVERVGIVSNFAAPSDSGFLVPKLFYYLSMFIPFEPDYHMFGLSAAYLIGLPCSLYYAIRARGSRWMIPNVLFLLSLSIFVLIELTAGRIAFYKWSLFAAVIYAVSFGILVSLWSAPWQRLFWILILLIAGLNYHYIGSPMIGRYLPNAFHQKDRWNELVVFLNGYLEPNAVVAGIDARTNYYLRRDVVGIEEWGVYATDWGAEEEIIRKERVKFYVKYLNEGEINQAFYNTFIKLWLQLCPGDRRNADFLYEQYTRNKERTRQRELFLGRHGELVKELPAGIRVYRLLL